MGGKWLSGRKRTASGRDMTGRRKNKTGDGRERNQYVLSIYTEKRGDRLMSSMKKGVRGK